MISEIQVTKRDGTKEKLDLEKFHKVVSFACEGISGVSASEVEIRSNIQFYTNIKTSDIQETLIKAAADLISEETPNYQFVAANLINYHLRKQVYGQFEPIRLYDHITKIVKLGYYDSQLLDLYTEEEWDVIEKFVDHSRDFDLTYGAMEQLRGKYLVQNRVTRQIYETPQVLYILVASILFAKYDKKIRLKWVKDFYDNISTHVISLPTPIMAGVRTSERQYASCVLIESADTLDSIIATSGAIMKYVSARAGIGIGGGRIRALGSPVKGGAKYHTGTIPYFKSWQSAVGSCSQGGVRKGSATLHVVMWHLDIEDQIVLKNNKGTEDNRVRHLDYSVQINKTMYERLINNQKITLFSPSDVPDLYDAYFESNDKFKELYEKYEKNPRIRKKVVDASHLFEMLMQERKDTGRIYIQHVDHCNDHSSFLVPIRMSNLCQEVTLPTKPLEDLNDPTGEIATCILAAINWGKIKEPKDFEKPCMLAVRALYELIDYQEYPVLAAKIATLNRRSVGVGIINFAFWLAREGFSYQNISPEGLAKIHQFAEAWSYYLIKASIDIAKERGACPLSNETKYSKGIMPIDTYKKEVDELTPPVYFMNWDQLRADAKEYGIATSTLMCLMPSEASSVVSGSTNGIEPPRAFVSIKGSKEGMMVQIVPGFKRLKNKYDLLWDQKRPHGYLKIVAVLQKFIDQSISTNTTYNPDHYDGDLSSSELLRDLIFAYKYGLKTLYYFNTQDGAGEIKVNDLPQSEATEEDDCSSCKI